MTVDKNYYPGFVRKAITFSIDDGNLKLDKKLLDILRPAGIFGTFNIGSPNLILHTAEEYLSLYEGYGIANHCAYHPYALDPSVEYRYADDSSNPDIPDEHLLYPTEISGLYNVRLARGMRKIATREAYLSFVDKAKVDIQAVFGEGSVKSYVWPFCPQKDPEILAGIVARGYRSVRGVSEIKGTTNYAFPEDYMDWGFNAKHKSLLTETEKYAAYPDDGELKFFVFGVHSHDFENDNMWGELEAFAELYGNRREDFYSAPVDDIFDYKEAVDKLIVTDNSVYNPSELSLYMCVDGEYIILSAGGKIEK